eukprot:3630993-Pleurochrysis_carterae.AAC.2
MCDARRPKCRSVSYSINQITTGCEAVHSSTRNDVASTRAAIVRGPSWQILVNGGARVLLNLVGRWKFGKVEKSWQNDGGLEGKACACVYGDDRTGGRSQGSGGGGLPWARCDGGDRYHSHQRPGRSVRIASRDSQAHLVYNSPAASASSTCMRACVRACARACVCARARACVLVNVRVFARAHATSCTRVCACTRACAFVRELRDEQGRGAARERERAHVHAHAHARERHRVHACVRVRVPAEARASAQPADPDRRAKYKVRLASIPDATTRAHSCMPMHIQI